jgi:hypothetical protein
MPATAPAYADVAFALKPLKPERPAVAPPTEPLGLAPRLAVPNVPLKPETVDGGAKLRVVAAHADVVVPPALAITPVDLGAAKLTTAVFEVPGKVTVMVVVMGPVTVTAVLPVGGTVVVALVPPAGLTVEGVSGAVCADALNPAKRTAPLIAGIARVLIFMTHLLRRI